MATITVSIGTVTATVQANNARAAAVVGACADAIGAEGTDQERLQAVVNDLVRYMMETGRLQRMQAARQAAAAAANNDLKWE